MDIQKIDFNPDLFNNVYWHLEDAHHNNDIRYIWLFGGSSASKTYSEVQLLIKEMLIAPDNNAMVLRKFATDIRDSIFSDFKNIIAEWGLNDLFTIQQNYIKCVTGSFIRFRGLDNSEKIKGLSNFKYIVYEEISQGDEVDFKQIKKRMRGRVGQKFIGIFNPISEEHWIKQNVFDKDIWSEIKTDITEKKVSESGNSVILKTNYTDNSYIVGKWLNGIQIGGFVDQHVIADFEKDKISDHNYYLVYGLGNWGKIRTGGEFWKDFNTNKHLTKIGWNEDLPIHLSWDENVNPYLTCTVWQILPGDNKKTLVQIDEICLEDPRNRVKHVCAEFKVRFPVNRVTGLFIGGDRTSWKEDTKKEKGENFFTDIINHLDDYRPILQLQSVNPSIVQSAGFINQIYAGNIESVEILINEKCKRSINDYSYSLEDSDGTLKKTKKKHPVTGVTYEEYGHPSDAKRYKVCVAFRTEYENYKNRKGKASVSYGTDSHTQSARF